MSEANTLLAKTDAVLLACITASQLALMRIHRKAALAESMYSGSVGRKQPLFSESDLAELLKPLSD